MCSIRPKIDFIFDSKKKNDAHRQKKYARQVKNIAEIQFYEEKDRKRCLQSVFLIRPATRTRKHLNIYAHNRSDTTILKEAPQFQISIQIVLKQSSIYQID